MNLYSLFIVPLAKAAGERIKSDAVINFNFIYKPQVDSIKMYLTLLVGYIEKLFNFYEKLTLFQLITQNHERSLLPKLFKFQEVIKYHL